MQYALVNGTRAEATKGAKGVCPGCARSVLAKCGEIMVHHWAHQAAESCDFEREGMTKWHLDWQKEFPEHMREVVLGPHRADVKTDHWVIEFQHSSISHEKVRERTDHWSKDSQVLWVANMNGVAKSAFIHRRRKRSSCVRVWVNAEARYDEWIVDMPRRNQAICSGGDWMAFHDPDEEFVYLGQAVDKYHKQFFCFRYSRKEFVDLMLLNTWVTEAPVPEKPDEKPVVTGGEFPGSPAYGEVFTWRQRSVCFLGTEEMYFADVQEAPRLTPAQSAMALTYYMTPVRKEKSKGRCLSPLLTPAQRDANRLAYQEELDRFRKQTRLGEVLDWDRVRV